MRRLITILFVLMISHSLFAQESVTDQHQLTLQRAIELALENNLEIQVQQFTPEIVESDVTFEKARFEPLFAANLNTNDSISPPRSALEGAGQVLAEAYDFNFNFSQLLQTGTLYEVVFNNSRTRTNQLFESFNPSYNSTFFVSVTQPLLRNFGLAVTKAPLHIAQTNRLAEDQRLRQRMMDISLQVEQAYWDLYFAFRELQVQKQSLGQAQELYENNKKQVAVGTMAPLEIVVAEAEVASREELIILSEAAIKNTADRLKVLVFGTTEPEKWNRDIFPTDEPQLREIQIDEGTAISRALADNPDIKAIQLDLQSNKLNTKLNANGLRPQLDLQASVGYEGLGGSTQILDDNFPPNVISTIPGGYSDAIDTLFDNRTWRVGFIVGIPIGNKAAEARFIRADLTEKQTAKFLENAKQQLTLNVRTTLRNLESDGKRLEAARVSRRLQEKKLEAEKKKLNVGLSTNFIVLDFQEDLASAQSAELRALVAYNKNYAQLERHMGNNLK